MTYKIKSKKVKDISLPIEQVIYVPSTNKYQKNISNKEMDNRVQEVEHYLSNKYGGYTAIKSEGGYVMQSKKPYLIKENVVKVTSFSTSKDYKKSKPFLTKQLREWGKKWGQESMGYEHEGDLSYIKSKNGI